MTQAPIIQPVMVFSSPFGSQTSKPIGKNGAANMLLGFIRRFARTTKSHAPSQQRHLWATGIGSSNLRSSCFAGSFGFLTSIFVPQLRQRSALSSFSQPQPWQTFIKFTVAPNSVNQRGSTQSQSCKNAARRLSLKRSFSRNVRWQDYNKISNQIACPIGPVVAGHRNPVCGHISILRRLKGELLVRGHNPAAGDGDNAMPVVFLAGRFSLIVRPALHHKITASSGGGLARGKVNA